MNRRPWDLRKVAGSVVLSGAAFAAACGSYFAPNRNIRDRLDDSAVVGTWHLTSVSLRLVERDGFKRDPSHKYALTFSQDGTCEFASVDTWDKLSYIAVPCTWILEHDTTGNSNQRKANALKLVFDHGERQRATYLNFAREDGSLVLWKFYGDPDLREFLEYVRERK